VGGEVSGAPRQPRRRKKESCVEVGGEGTEAGAHSRVRYNGDPVVNRPAVELLLCLLANEERGCDKRKAIARGT